MRKIAFVGAYDKTDLILYIAKICQEFDKKILIVDATVLQKAKYVVPVVNPTRTYVTEFEKMDFAVGFDCFEDIADYVGVQDLSEAYDMIFVDTDNYDGFEKFNILDSEKIFFTTSFDIYSLKRGLEIFSGLEQPIKLTKVLFSKNMLREEDEYLDFLSMKYSINWDKDKIFFPFDSGDQSAIYDNQRSAKIRFRNLSTQYKDAMLYLAESILETEGIGGMNVKKVIRKIEKGV